MTGGNSSESMTIDSTWINLPHPICLAVYCLAAIQFYMSSTLTISGVPVVILQDVSVDPNHSWLCWDWRSEGS